MKHIQKPTLLFLIVLLLFTPLLLSSCGEANYNEKDFQSEKYADPVYVKIEIKRYGDITLELYPHLAPKTVENFLSLVRSGFYSGNDFHRVIADFMIQGGAPAEGDPAPGQIIGEFSANGFANDLKHTRGILSMARGDDYNSASSQFFIVHKTSSHLDGKYAAFGRVVRGMRTVDKIASLKTNDSDVPLKSVIIKQAYVTDAPSPIDPTIIIAVAASVSGAALLTVVFILLSRRMKKKAEAERAAKQARLHPGKKRKHK